jgi:hypothetical protein
MKPKRRSNLNPPMGYPYLLYQVTAGEDLRYVVGATEEQACRLANAKTAKAEPASVNTMVYTIGHEKTHHLLAKFGEQWVCKEGLIYFK